MKHIIKPLWELLVSEETVYNIMFKYCSGFDINQQKSGNKVKSDRPLTYHGGTL